MPKIPALRALIISVVMTVALIFAAGGFFYYAATEAATGQMGMSEIVLPSGRTLWLRRQSYAHTPEQLYISPGDDYCAPYRHGHDWRMPDGITGSPEDPLLVSFSSDSLIVHAPGKPTAPWFTGFNGIHIEFAPISDSDYRRYVAGTLPTGWKRIEVEWGHNTCSL
jgi:hypothetical protein